MYTNDGSSGSHTDFLIVLNELEGFIDRHRFDLLLVVRNFNVVAAQFHAT